MEKTPEKKKMKLHVKIFIALFAGIIFGYILNFMGGTDHPIIGAYIIPFLQFLGDMFIRLIRMIVVPLVFFTIMDAALSLGDVKKLQSIGLKTVGWFLATGFISAMIGLVVVNIIQPGKGFLLGEAVDSVKVKELPGIYQTILDLVPMNPFAALTSGEMMQIIVFSLFLGVAMLAIGPKAEPMTKLVNLASQVMFKVVDFVLGVIPYGVFGLMSVALAKYGVAIFGPVAKFILTDYLANFVIIAGLYTVLLVTIARVSPIMFWRKAFEPWLIAFSTCTSAAALPVAMEITPRRLGVSPQISNFVLPLGCTAQMNGTCTFFACIVLFAAQLYGMELSISQQIMLCIQATMLSVGCAATPQIGLVISLTLLTQMGLPLEAYALVAGIYRIIDQAHTSTNASGDIVASVCLAAIEGELDREIFNDPEAGLETEVA